MPRAACVLLVRPDGKILSISRGENTSDWGLPGGKVEKRETLPEAARNELREETGIVADQRARFLPIFIDRSVHYVTSTFHVDGRLFFPLELKSTPFEGYVEWKNPSELCTPQCSFADYSTRMFSHLGML